jgi:3-hydroxyacyl-CoA dehydrogenase
MNTNIKNVLVIGAGVMGEGIALNFAQAGLEVTLVARHQETLDSAMVQIKENLEQFAEYGLITESPDTVLARVHPVPTNDVTPLVVKADYIVETIPEVLDRKREILTQIMSVPGNATIASNTSSMTIDMLVEGLNSPERVVGLHYFNPAHIIPLVEIHRGKLTSDAIIEETKTLMENSGKKAVLVRKSVPGFIVNRLTGAFEREIDYLLDEGIVTPEDLDVAIKNSIGFRFACLGPMEVEDMIGLDTAARVSGRVFKVLSNATEPSPELVKKVEKGELGVKSGKGWYDYSDKPRSEVLKEQNLKLIKQLVRTK